MTWALAGCDWAYFLAEFLRGRRRLDIQPAEIVKTQLYQRSSEAEQRALCLVCETGKEINPLREDERRLRIRDQFLMNYVDGHNLGHADLVKELTSIPAKVAERDHFDRAMFARVYDSPRLFDWIWER
jgi:hypothetical protein